MPTVVGLVIDPAQPSPVWSSVLTLDLCGFSVSPQNMVYQPSDIVSTPEDDDTPVWRYMDFPKFMWTLQESKLHFHRADLFGDPFEGTVPAYVKEIRREEYESKREDDSDFPEDMDEIHAELSKRLRQFTFLNCWHQNPRESAAMWELYGEVGKSIAIESTMGDFKNAFNAHPDHEIYIGEVDYDIYKGGKEEAEEAPEEFLLTGGANSMAPFFRKRESFKHENEVRAIIQTPPVLSDDDEFPYLDFNMIIGGEERKEQIEVDTGSGAQIIDTTEQPKTKGINVNVDLERLINRVHIAPDADDWFADTVAQAVEDCEDYDFDGDITERSELDADPIF